MYALSVVFPLYNEVRRLPAAREGLEWLRARYGRVEAVWVDDGSTDDTLAEVRAGAGPDDVVVAAPHRGKGAALQAGVAAARGDRLLLTDADWSVGPHLVPELLAVDADVVLATREGADARRVGEPLVRHWLGRGFNHAVQTLILAGHEDTQCGCKVLRAPVAKALFPALTVDGFAFDVELLYLAHIRGHRVREVPVVWRYEADSRVRPVRDALAMARDVWRVRRNARAGRYR
ncbi:MAG: glycosyltransferase [Pseudomonadota bacterium]|nr:glycosyltransferase [Pseudomonadota bacterium]